MFQSQYGQESLLGRQQFGVCLGDAVGLAQVRQGVDGTKPLAMRLRPVVDVSPTTSAQRQAQPLLHCL